MNTKAIRRHRRLTPSAFPGAKAALGLAMAAVLAVSACGGSSDSAAASGEPAERLDAVPELQALLPDEIRERGYVTAATDPAHPPYEFVDDDDEIIGMDPEIGNALGDLLGIEIRYESVEFSGIIASVLSGRYDLSLLAMFDTPERQKQIDFVDFLIDGDRLIVQDGNPLGINDLDDLCGKDVSILAGSAMLDLLEEQQPKCDEKMNVAVASSTSDQLLQVQSGRAVATLANGLVTQYSIDVQGAEGLEVVTDNIYVEGYYGFGFAKKNSELRDAFHAALNELIDRGTYAEILDKWNVPASNAVEEALVNGGTL